MSIILSAIILGTMVRGGKLFGGDLALGGIIRSKSVSFGATLSTGSTNDEGGRRNA